jgi:hypothetical protein
MLFEETSGNPLIDGDSDHLDQFSDTGLISFVSLVDGFEEESDESFKRVLIHVVNDAKRDQ